MRSDDLLEGGGKEGLARQSADAAGGGGREEEGEGGGAGSGDGGVGGCRGGERVFRGFKGCRTVEEIVGACPAAGERGALFGVAGVVGRGEEEGREAGVRGGVEFFGGELLASAVFAVGGVIALVAGGEREGVEVSGVAGAAGLNECEEGVAGGEGDEEEVAGLAEADGLG